MTDFAATIPVTSRVSAASFVTNPLPPTSEAVNRERDRRIMLSKTVTLPNAGTITIDMSNGGRDNIGQLGTAAIAKTMLGDNSTISFRDSSNTDRSLTNADIIAMGLQVMQQVSAIHIFARTIKAMNPIPQNFADNSYWTA
jgi:hypothetical protein